MRRLLFVLLLLNQTPAFTADTAKSDHIRFGQDIYSVLRRACFECHGPARQEGDLRLDQRRLLFDSGMIVPGVPEDSELLRRIELPKGHEEVMPAVGDPLPPDEIRAIRAWIQNGAHWPKSFRESKHWSYIPPERPELPELMTLEPWARNPVDYFAAAKLEAESLSPSEDAPPETLIRRVYLDLIGLPPTPQDVRRFAADPSDEAYLEIVNDLLGRPQFGERWARPWLDMARYADSHGFQRDNFRDIWAYRDWVIRALNSDMPFDQFTLEQIAGDLLPEASETQRIATGFHRCTPTNVEAGSLPEETRIEQVIDRVNTTGAVWLGSTIECCQCHDHKYDPFTARDYYRLLAFFNSTEAEADRTDPKKPSSIQFRGPKMDVSNADKEARRKRLAERQAELQTLISDRRRELGKQIGVWLSDYIESETPGQTHLLEVTKILSNGQEVAHAVLDDGSILMTDKDVPDKADYVVHAHAAQPDITAIHLDLLTDDSLPGNGPGRGDAARPNVVLNRFSGDILVSSNTSPLKFGTAVADFSQKNWDVTGALKDAPKSGWAIAPEFGKPHWARFILDSPVTCDDKSTIRITLSQQYGGRRSMGRFRLSVVTGNPLADSLPTDIMALAGRPVAQWTAANRTAAIDFRQKLDDESLSLQSELAAIDGELKKIEPDTTLVMVELDQPRMSYVFDRGDYQSPSDRVQPGTPEVLHPLPEGPPNRITLAKWLANRQNPLVARVTVNRWWGEIFGTGLVSTPEDFGIKGERPSHPKLLDWLAVEFMDSGWSMKHILRTIVTSSTYRQSSQVSAELYRRDDQNRLLARGPRFRMDAEMIRDNILSVSGLLSLKQFGPPIRPYQPDGIWSKVGGEAYKYVVSPGAEQYRRGVYVVLKRGAPYPSFVNFDATSRLSCTVQRSRTNTPLQALTLLNDPVYVEAAQALAARVITEKSIRSPDDRIRYAFRLCTARTPTNRETGILRQLLETQRRQNRSSTRFKPLRKTPLGVDPVNYSAWVSVASTLLNLHETITKN